MTVHIDPSFVTMAVALLVHAIALGWGASRLASGLKSLGDRMNKHDEMASDRDAIIADVRQRLVRVETMVEHVYADLDELLGRHEVRGRSNGRHARN